MSTATTTAAGRLAVRRLALVAGAALTALSLGVGPGLVLATEVVAVGDAELVAGAGTVVLDNYGPHGTVVQRYAHGDEVSLEFTLSNPGPLPVVIEHVDALTPRLGMLAPLGVTVGGAPLPVRLAAGDRATVDVRARFDNCEYYTERALERHDHAAVTWSLLGISRTSQVSYGRDVVVRSPTMVGGCGDRVMDRSAKQRSMEMSPTGRG